MNVEVALSVWRHPRPLRAAGRCVGRIDLPVDPRRARRLAGRIRRAARREGRPPVVFTSPSTRCRAVGRWLKRWGWDHRIDARLLEADFGGWEGRTWASIGQEAVDAWVADFADHRPGGGESVLEVLARCRQFLIEVGPSRASVVTHGGWISALAWRTAHGTEARPRARDWPRAIGHARRWSAVRAGRTPGTA